MTLSRYCITLLLFSFLGNLKFFCWWSCAFHEGTSIMIRWTFWLRIGNWTLVFSSYQSRSSIKPGYWLGVYSIWIRYYMVCIASFQVQAHVHSSKKKRSLLSVILAGPLGLLHFRKWRWVKLPAFVCIIYVHSWHASMSPCPLFSVLGFMNMGPANQFYNWSSRSCRFSLRCY